MNLSIHKTYSGIQLDDTGYRQLAVGNIARPKGDATCCQDVVLGGPLSSEVEVFFGGGSTTNGLTFLDARPTQAYSMASGGDGIQDLALVDLNADGLNDLVSLTTGDQLGVRLGLATAPYFGALNNYKAHGGVASSLGSLEFGYLDCDADLDIAVTAPNDAGVIILLQSSGGSFGSGVFVATPPAAGETVAGNPQDVAIGNLDGYPPLDLVSMNDDGTATTYFQSRCGEGVSTKTTKVVYSEVGDCPNDEYSTCISDTLGSHVITDDVFCDTALSDVTVAFADRVLVFCNDGDINDAIGVTGFADHRWDVNTTGKPSSIDISAVAWWPSPAALYVIVYDDLLRLADPGTLLFGDDTPKILGLQARGAPAEFELIRHSDDGASDWWQRLVWVVDAAGNPGETTFGDSGLGFAR